jgi:hypothetical protein
MHATVDAQLPQKVPKQKICPIPRKLANCDYPLIKGYEQQKNLLLHLKEHEKISRLAVYCSILSHLVPKLYAKM